jgi:hypothetical protein
MIGADLPDPGDHIYAADAAAGCNESSSGELPVSSSILTKVNLVDVSLLELKLHRVAI